jgi:hypothetical protein
MVTTDNQFIATGNPTAGLGIGFQAGDFESGGNFPTSAVFGKSTSGIGVIGISTDTKGSAGVGGESNTGPGVTGASNTGPGVTGSSDSGDSNRPADFQFMGGIIVSES